MTKWLKTWVLLTLNFGLPLSPPTLAIEQPMVDCRPLPRPATTETVDDLYAIGLLYEIKTSASTVNYLFGTIHLPDPAVVDLDPIVWQALAGSRIFIMEALPEPAAMAALGRLSLLQKPEPSLNQTLAPAVYQNLLRLLAPYRIDADMVTRLKPWAVFLTISAPPANGRRPLDLMLLDRAREHGADVHGLETLQEQALVLDRLSKDDQVRLILDSVCHHDKMQKDLDELIKLYKQRRLSEMLNNVRKFAAVDETYRHVTDDLLYARNTRMAERLDPYLRRGGVFAAVGAAHLAGDRGLLAQASRRGYTVTRVY